MEFEYSTYNFDEKLLDDKEGSWRILGIIDYPDLELKDEENKLCSLINYRMSAIKVWYSNGPQYYVLTYSHNITSYKKDKKKFTVNLLLKDNNKKVMIKKNIIDNIYHEDKNRRTFWTYVVNKNDIDKIFSSSANLFIN